MKRTCDASKRSLGKRAGIIVILAVLSCLFFAAPAMAALAVDGSFADWTGQPNIPDGSGDAAAYADVDAFFYANNPNDENLYFMIKRRDNGLNYSSAVIYKMLFDIDRDGKYNKNTDRYATVSYTPGNKTNLGTVSVALYRGNGGKSIASYSGTWGESSAVGGQRCEFSISMANLGTYPYNPIHIYTTSIPSLYSTTTLDRVPDTSYLQWSPIPTLGWVLLGVFVVGAVIFGVRRMRMAAQ